MNRKRYKDQVEITVRLPREIRDEAQDVVRGLEGIYIEVPGVEEPVKASIAVLAIRGLVAELEKLSAAAKRGAKAGRALRHTLQDEDEITVTKEGDK